LLVPLPHVVGSSINCPHIAEGDIRGESYISQSEYNSSNCPCGINSIFLWVRFPIYQVTWLDQTWWRSIWYIYSHTQLCWTPGSPMWRKFNIKKGDISYTHNCAKIWDFYTHFLHTLLNDRAPLFFPSRIVREIGH